VLLHRGSFFVAESLGRRAGRGGARGRVLLVVHWRFPSLGVLMRTTLMQGNRRGEVVLGRVQRAARDVPAADEPLQALAHGIRVPAVAELVRAWFWVRTTSLPLFLTMSGRIRVGPAALGAVMRQCSNPDPGARSSPCRDFSLIDLAVDVRCCPRGPARLVH